MCRSFFLMKTITDYRRLNFIVETQNAAMNGTQRYNESEFSNFRSATDFCVYTQWKAQAGASKINLYIQ